jgi:Zn-dependent peptidase ImmA (M78 family)
MAQGGMYEERRRPRQLFADKRVSFCRPGDDLLTPAYRREVEANLFDSALLMPRSAVLKEIEFYSLNLDEEKDMKLLANRFRASIPTMARRLQSLRLMLPEENSPSNGACFVQSTFATRSSADL